MGFVFPRPGTQNLIEHPWRSAASCRRRPNHRERRQPRHLDRTSGRSAELERTVQIVIRSARLSPPSAPRSARSKSDGSRDNGLQPDLQAPNSQGGRNAPVCKKTYVFQPLEWSAPPRVDRVRLLIWPSAGRAPVRTWRGSGSRARSGAACCCRPRR